MKRRFPWNVLGIDQTSDKGAIRRAYADALRAIDVDSDIAGYAELRRARDQALWLAAEAERGEPDDFGLGDFGDDGGYEPAAYADPFAEDVEWWDAPARSSRPAAPPTPPATPPADIEVEDAPEAEPDFTGDDEALDGDLPGLDEAQQRAQAAWQGLLAILYPDGGPSDDGVTHDELEEGLAHLDLLLVHAEESDLAEHDALDHALANLMADTWPRSAPFVEPANATFHWLDEAGQIEERPPLMFLNARLKGMRFHEKVQQPGHPLNKAWVELSQPGATSFFQRMWVKWSDVNKLLEGIRKNFPELESHLDPQRVASWEGTNTGQGMNITGPRLVRGIALVLFLIFVSRQVVDLLDPRTDDPSAPASSIFASAPTGAEADAAAADIFGQGIGMAEVRAADPVFADQFRLALTQMSFNKDAPIALARVQALESGEVADFDGLVARGKLRRMWLVAARRQSEELCRNIMSYDFTSLPLTLTAEERAIERALLAQLLRAKVLSHEVKGGQVRYTIPGWAVTDLIARSKLGEDAVRKAMGDTDHPNRCAVEIALADVVLANTGRVSREMLQGL